MKNQKRIHVKTGTPKLQSLINSIKDCINRFEKFSKDLILKC